MRKSVAAGLAGAVLTALTLFGVDALGGGLPTLIVLVAILAFLLVAMADITALAYTPAAFMGAACFFGSGAKLDTSALFVCLTWCLGVFFGLASEHVGKRLARPA